MDREFIEDVMESGSYIKVSHDLFAYCKPLTACVFSYIYGFLKKNMAVYGGNKKIAEIFCVSEETVRRAIDELVSKGFLEIRRGQRGMKFSLPTGNNKTISQSAKCGLGKAVEQDANTHYPYSGIGKMRISQSAKCGFPNPQNVDCNIKDNKKNIANNNLKVTDYCGQKEISNPQNEDLGDESERMHRIIKDNSIKYNVHEDIIGIAILDFIKDTHNLSCYNDDEFGQWFNSPAGKNKINTMIEEYNKKHPNHKVGKL